MSVDQRHALSDGITFKASVPIEWRRLESLPSDEVQLQSSNANQRLLSALNILEDVPLEIEKSQVGKTEPSHTEAKLDLILGLLGELMRQQIAVPEPMLISVSAHGISIIETYLKPLPTVGELLSIRVYFDSRYPQAFVLTGAVTATAASGFTAEFRGLSDAVQEQLDKLIFRQHRRAIASTRRETET